MNYFVAFILGIISYALINNVVLSRFYGICSFVGVGNKVKSAAGMGIAVTFVIILATLICYPLYKLLDFAGVPFLDTITYILVIASLVQVVGLIIKKYSPSLYKSLGIYLPLITTNCAVLGVVTENTDSGLTFLESLSNAIGTSLGFFLTIFLFACIRVRLESGNASKPWKGVPIAIICACLMAMAFMGLGGIV